MILDTNALSAIADGDPNLEPILRHAAEIMIPSIVLGEYRFGVLRSRHRKVYEKWLAGVALFARILVVDDETALNYASVRDEL